MSKDNPEVNDIWLVNGREFFITSTTARIDAIDGITEKGLAITFTDKENFAKSCKFIRKSKLSIEKLFEDVI